MSPKVILGLTELLGDFWQLQRVLGAGTPQFYRAINKKVREVRLFPVCHKARMPLASLLSWQCCFFCIVSALSLGDSALKS